MIKFSVIVPIYNVEKYLKECIESVLNQTFTNFELILVNDGSPDNSEQICKSFLSDSRVRYIKKVNEGVAIARNYGIANSSGDYIFCLDGDDTIEKDFLKKIALSVSNFHSDLIIVGKSFVREKIELIGALPTWGFAVSRMFLEKHPKIRFIEGMQPCEDGLFSHQLLILAQHITFCPDAEYIYRQHDSSSEARIKGEKIINEIPKWFEILEKFYDEYSLWDNNKDNLLAFIHNEPYNIRFLHSNFSIENKVKIFNLVHDFAQKHSLICNNIYFEKDFRAFINSRNFYSYLIKHTFLTCKKNIKNFRQLRIAYCSGCRNVGDDFNIFLLKKLKIPYKKVKYSNCNTLLVGSNLDNVVVPKNSNKYLSNSTVVNVVGTGFIEKERDFEKTIRKLNILAIRGKLSLGRLINFNDVVFSKPVLADLGILASKIYPIKNTNKIYDLGIIPHYNDKKSDFLFNNINLNKYNFKFINVQQDCASFFSEINKCRCIFSSSLHGLIFADSYNIPNIQILLSDNVYGNNYKFKDYYSAYNIDYPNPLDIRMQVITDELIDNVIEHYQSKINVIEAKQSELLKILNSL